MNLLFVHRAPRWLWLTAFLLSALLPPCSIHAADAAGEPPVFPVGAPMLNWKTLAQCREQLAPLMALSEEQALALCPEVNGLLFSPCPNCRKGAHETDLAWLGVNDPQHVRCKSCQMVFPNAQYPLDHSAPVRDRAGVVHTWRWHELPDGNRAYFLARARFDAKDYLGKAIFDLATAYRLSGEAAYARRAAVLLDRLAQVYPAWNVMHDYPKPGGKYPVENAKPPYTTWNGVWARWWYYEIPTSLIHAYDLLNDTGIFEQLAQERRQPVAVIRHRIEDDFFRGAIGFVRTYKEIYTNASPAIYIGLIAGGRVLHDPELVHDGVTRAATLFRTQFYADGLWHEGALSYHWMTLNYMQRVLLYAAGYSDPPSYTPPAGQARFNNLDMGGQFPIIARAQIAPLRLTWPTGRAVAVHDSWPKETYPTTYAQGPMLLSHYGHARLTTASTANPMQAHLHYSGASSHAHADNLSLLLFANGEELLPDIGYTWTTWRFWTSSTISHNTVAVDHQDCVPDRRTGLVTLLSMQPGQVQVIEASQPWSFGKTTTEYRRRLLLVPLDEQQAYVVDVFHVRGGSSHDYFLHGHAERAQQASASLELVAQPDTLLGPGVSFRLPRDHTDRGETGNHWPAAYAMVRELRAASTDHSFQVDWQFTDAGAPTLRTHVLGQPGVRVVLGRSPQVRPVGAQFKEAEDQLPNHWRPTLVLQRQGAAPLASRFVVVHEPLTSQSGVKQVEIVQENPLVLRVTHRTGVDWILADSAGDDAAVTLGQQRLVARAAVLRQADAGGVQTWTLSSPTQLRGRIGRSVRDDAQQRYGVVLQIKEQPPADELAALTGQAARLIVGDSTGQAYVIRSAERAADGLLLWLDGDPGFDCTPAGVEYACYPPHAVAGPARGEVDVLSQTVRAR